ncbi:hypothetical protein [Sphingomonas immobilis]|uniref:Histidine kinase n=1 Tax=Sphingomonas immobilis TaxID=3063997 RepID=A0ABT8ZW23_9SPHN|nr:hypothetical protein [Sphingomonas sp. CA1-15]MDO7841768.1 hypothetical protein [Sphingomonas sp. CA1-15]
MIRQSKFPSSVIDRLKAASMETAPAALAAEAVHGAPDQRCTRMFVLSHIYGPCIGLCLSIVLLVLGFAPDGRLLAYSALVALFWLYPPILAAGGSHRALSLLSLQHLTVTVFWASYAYGGLKSPFLLWLVFVPLLASFYLTPPIKMWLLMLLILGVETVAFVHLLGSLPPGQEIEQGVKTWLALISIVSACAYIAMMAIELGRSLDSRDELALEAAECRMAADTLDCRVTDLCKLQAARLASISRLEAECRAPLAELVENCHHAVGQMHLDGNRSDRSDMESIDIAIQRLQEILDEVRCFSSAKKTIIPAQNYSGN